MNSQVPDEHSELVAKGQAPCSEIEELRREIVRLRMENEGLRRQIHISSEWNTAKQQFEVAATEATKKEQIILDQIPDSAWLKDSGGRFLAVNKVWCEFMGLRAEDVIGRPDSDFFSPTTVACFHQQEDAVIESGQACRFEQMLCDKHGDFRWFESFKAPLISFTGKIRGTFGIARDITDRKRLEESLRESENRLRFALEGANDGIWDVQMKSGQVYLSPRGCEILGYSPEELPHINQVWSQFVHPDDLPRTHEKLNEYLEGRTPLFEVEQRLRTKTGDWKWVLARGKVVARDQEGFALRMTGTHTDITERKRAETERQELQLKLSQSQKMDAIGRLAGGIAHDFNNVLAAMMMHLGLLQEDPKVTEEVKASIDELMVEANRASNLIRQLLLFSRRSVVEFKVLDLAELVSDVLRMLRRLIGENIKLHFNRDAGLPAVEADLGMIEQVVTNLVVNARDAMPKGGEITISIAAIEAHGDGKRGPESRIGQFVCLSVADTGSGMDEPTLGRIFEPFFTTKAPGKGNGLGLATVQSVMAQHKGWVEVESELCKGSTFKVFFPVTSKVLDVESHKGTPH